MKISYKWLKTYININLAPEELYKKFNSLGLNVETYVNTGNDITGVIVGRINSINKHPNADKLVLCEVDTGGKLLSIVCGAKNMKEGDRVPVAVDGAVLPGNFNIKKTNIRGISSDGMMCSAKELGISEDAAGLLILPADAPLGKDIVEYLDLKDSVYDLEILPNRPDYLSYIGVARVLSASLKKPLKLPELRIKENKKIKAKDKAKIVIKDAILCPRYAGRVVFGIKLGESPAWMQNRLKSAGIRPINNVVDISNYVLMETGHPLHTFDYDLIENHTIIVRRAAENEVFTTLDGQDRKLTNDMLVIADSKRAVALAGIMGGLNSEISDKTVNVLIESAYFNPVNIRKTSKALGLSTEASYRFERGADYEGLVYALDRTTALTQRICGGDVLNGYAEAYPKKLKQKKISVRFERINKILGTEVKNSESVDICKRLGFKVTKKSASGFEVLVPTFRTEVYREIDMVEEVGQIYGYDRIKGKLPAVNLKVFSENPEIRVEDEIKKHLVNNNLFETINFGFIGKNTPDKMGLNESHPWRTAVIELINPLTDEWNIMRPSLFTGLIGNIALNIVSKGNKNARFFEIGHIFGKQDGYFNETKSAGIILSGIINEPSWMEKSVEASFYHLKGIISGLMEALNINFNIVDSASFLFDINCSGEIIINGEKAGCCGEVLKNIASAFDIKNKVFYAEISLPIVLKYACFDSELKALKKFPSIRRDISFVISKNTPAEKIKTYIEGLKNILIEEVNIIDVYEGQNVEHDRKSITYSIIYRDENKTLKDEEADIINNEITNKIMQEFNANVKK